MKPRRALKEKRDGRPWAVLAVAVCAIAGSLLAVLPSMAMLSDNAGVDSGAITAGDLDVEVDPAYTWSLTTDPEDPDETITGGPSTSDHVEDLWMGDDTYLDVYWTGAFILEGDNIVANLLWSLDAVGTACETLAGMSPCTLTVLEVVNETATPVGTEGLTQGSYTFQLRLRVSGEGLVHSPLFSGDSTNWMLTLGTPIVTLQQVRS